MYKIAYATGSRADYSIVRNYLLNLNEQNDINLDILVTASLLDDEYGHQVDLIYNDGLNVKFENKVHIDNSSNAGITNCMAEILSEFGNFFENNKYDLLIILGDRYEMMSVAIAASMNRIPILHIHGGEATYSNYDEFIRHSITKMSLYHFTSTEEYRKRVIQLGESPDRVFNLGALGAQNCKYINTQNVTQDIKKLEGEKYFVVLFHPETLRNGNEQEQTEALLSALNDFPDYKIAIIGSNSDTNSYIIRNMIKTYAGSNSNVLYFENLHNDSYHYLVKNALCLIGNSSSGIIEAPSLDTATVNIGHRQDGRTKGKSVLDVECKHESISKAIDFIINNNNEIDYSNPYYQENACEKYISKTLDILKNMQSESIIKIFYDIGDISCE